MPYFGIPIRNGLPIGLGSVAGFGIAPFDPSQLFSAGEQGAWYDPSDFTTLFEDAAGTLPITSIGAGSPKFVGLMLDKSAPVAQTGYYSGAFDGSGDFLNLPGSASLGFGTGDFTFECWFYANTLHTGALIDFRPSGVNGAYLNCAVLNTGQVGIYVNNAARITSTATYTAGSWNHIAVTRSSGSTRVFLNGVQSGITWSDATNYIVGANRPAIGANGFATSLENFNGYISNFRLVNATALYTSTFTPPSAPLTAISGTSLLTLQNNYFKDNSSNAFAVTSNGNPAPNLLNPFNATAARSVNNATSTGTKRPKLAARYNLLTYTEQFDNTAEWDRTTSPCTVNANTVTAPDGTTTADTIIPTTGNSVHALYSQNKSFVNGTTYRQTLYVQAAGYNFWQFTTGLTGDYINFNLSTKQVGNSTAFFTGTIQDVGGGWCKCEVTFTSSLTSNQSIRIVPLNADTAARQPSFAGDGTSGIYIWGADLRPASQATGLIGPIYQRVVDAATYDTVGFLPYLQFDGIDDSMSTGSIDFTATDKMTVWAGVRKLSDAAAAILAELTTDGFTTAGGFYVAAPSTASNNYGFADQGSYYEPSGYAAPITNVLSCAYDLSQSTKSTEISPRVNGILVQSGGSGSGTATGNFANASMFIGARNNASLYFNGRLTSLIVRGAQSTQSQIEATESWVNGKTGAY